jgi:hypothetical protein
MGNCQNDGFPAATPPENHHFGFFSPPPEGGGVGGGGKFMREAPQKIKLEALHAYLS